MHYKYKEIKTEGAFGTVLTYRAEDVLPLGSIGEFSYLYSLTEIDLDKQFSEIDMQLVTLTDDEIVELKKNKALKLYKDSARKKIRKIKSIDDDLVDTKQLVQFMARGFAGLWISLPQEIKDDNPYAANFDLFSDAIAKCQVRLDLNPNQVEKIAAILTDEENFAGIVKAEYLDKL